MEIVAYADGTVHVDARAAGQWRLADDRVAGTFEVQGVGVRFRIESISGGYAIEVVGRPLTPLRLVHTWRDGYDIEHDSRVDFTDSRVSLGGRVLADVSWTTLYVRVRCVGLTMPEAVPYAALIAVNNFFGNKTGPFEIRA
jgi:hypothetical protein